MVEPASSSANASRSANSDGPRRRVILLGASNLTRGIATVVETCHRLWGQPLDVMATLGHGRSYGARSTVLARSVPSILHSELWDAAAARGPAPTAALVTDIGNDLLYETPVDKIVTWVTGCLDKLAALDARVVMTRLPVENLDHVPEWKFRLLRRLMFPRGGLRFATIKERVHDLDARLRELAAARGIPLVEQPPAWYGWDPIHLHRRQWPSAWHTILSSWSDNPPAPATNNPSRWRTLYLRTRIPHQRWWFGIEQRGPQPCGRLSDGTAISLY